VLDQNLTKLNRGFEILRHDEGYHSDYLLQTLEAVCYNPLVLILSFRK
jgi:hypothetical protein